MYLLLSQTQFACYQSVIVMAIKCKPESMSVMGLLNMPMMDMWKSDVIRLLTMHRRQQSISQRISRVSC